MDWDINFKKPFNVNRGADIKFKNERGEEFITVPTESRRVIARITSFRGVSIGAIHYYGKLKFYDLNVKCLKVNDGYHKVGDVFGMAGYRPGYPDEADGCTIEITRKINKPIINQLSGDVEVKKGERTIRFDTVKKLKRKMKKEMNRLFPGWEHDFEDF